MGDRVSGKSCWRNSFKRGLLSALTVGVSPARRKIRFALLLLAVALLIVALARPQYGFDLQKVEQRGLDIVVAMDTSKSMLAEDIAPEPAGARQTCRAGFDAAGRSRTGWAWWRLPATRFWNVR